MDGSVANTRPLTPRQLQVFAIVSGLCARPSCADGASTVEVAEFMKDTYARGFWGAMEYLPAILDGLIGKGALIKTPGPGAVKYRPAKRG